MTRFFCSKSFTFIVVFFLFTQPILLFAQKTSSLSGTVKQDGIQSEALITVVLQPTNRVVYVGEEGKFSFANLLEGKYKVTFYQEGQEILAKDVTLGQEDLDMGTVQVDGTLVAARSQVAISYKEIETDDINIESASPLLQSSQDVFVRTASFEWGNFFFNPRGLDTRYNKVLINGIEMNKPNRGRPLWRNWGGLNNIMRYPVQSGALQSHTNHHGSLGITSNFQTRPSLMRKQVWLTSSFSNRNSYQYRFMGTYSSGLTKKGWAFAVSASARLGGDPLFSSEATGSDYFRYENRHQVNQLAGRQGGLFNSYSFFATAEKKWKKHSLAFSVIAALYQRGASAAPITKEAKDLFGIYYNPYWGVQEGKKRNSRIRTNFEPIVQLSHYWDISPKTSLQTTLSVQVGGDGNTRIQRFDQPSSSPIYYRYLPSYAIDGNTDPAQSLIFYGKNDQSIKNRQINWQNLYAVNNALRLQGRSAGYILVSQRENNTTYAFALNLKHQLSSQWMLYATGSFQNNFQHIFSEVDDLLGGGYISDADPFENAVRDANNPNYQRKYKGDKIDYSAYLRRNYAYGNFLLEWNLKNIELALGGRLSYTSVQRDGQFLNQRYPTSSFGKSPTITFIDPSVKLKVVYKRDKNFLIWNTMFGTEPQIVNNIFPNSRYENTYLDNITSEKIFATDLSYLYRSSNISLRATAYYISQSDRMNVTYYFVQASNYSAFVAEVLSGMETETLGGELGVKIKVSPTITVNAAASVGQYIYKNDPTVTTMGDPLLTEETTTPTTTEIIGTSYLSNLRLSSGPQQAYHVGLQYFSPSYWRLGIGVNYITSSFVQPSAIRRTELFSTDRINGITYVGYNQAMAQQLLRQEELPGSFYVNINISKSWRIKSNFLGFSLNINNVTNNLDIRTNGFEQSRYSSFPDLQAQANQKTSTFGNRYWYNQGLNFFLNVFFRF